MVFQLIKHKFKEMVYLEFLRQVNSQRRPARHTASDKMVNGVSQLTILPYISLHFPQ